MSVERLNVYKYRCNHAGCKKTVEQRVREAPKKWQEWTIGKATYHYCPDHAAQLPGPK